MQSIPSPAILTALQEGKMELKGEFMWGSNYTFLLEIEHKDLKMQAVYKPTRGVRPLWDFSTSSLAICLPVSRDGTVMNTTTT